MKAHGSIALPGRSAAADKIRAKRNEGACRSKDQEDGNACTALGGLQTLCWSDARTLDLMVSSGSSSITCFGTQQICKTC